MTNILTVENAPKIAGLTIRKSSEFFGLDIGSHFTFYGQGGSGKTTLAASAAEIGPTILLDAEGGVESISHRKDVDVVEIFNYRDFQRITEEFKSSSNGYKNVIIDNLCEIVDKCIYSLAGPSPINDIPEFKEWNQTTREIKYRVREWRDIARKHGINVFINAWDEDSKDERGILKKDLAFSPSLKRDYPGIVTIIGHIRVLNDPNKRLLDFAPSPKTVAKFRRNAKSSANKIPFQIEYGLENLPLPDILRTLRGEIEWPTKKYEAKASTSRE